MLPNLCCIIVDEIHTLSDQDPQNSVAGVGSSKGTAAVLETFLVKVKKHLSEVD